MEHADRIVGLHDGELVFEGPPSELDQRGLDQVYRGAAVPENTDGEKPRSRSDGDALSNADRPLAGEP
jgi:phosphonate transport system ATP-binding protein